MDEAPPHPGDGERSRQADYHQRRKAARREAGLDGAFESRRLARRLVDDAAARVDLRPDLSMRSNVVRLMLAMFVLHGSLNWRRGYVGRLQEVLSDGGCAVPSPKVIRWYRSKLAENPMVFSHCPMVDVTVLEAVERKYLRA